MRYAAPLYHTCLRVRRKALSIQGIAGQGELDNDVALILTDMRDALGPIVDTLPDLINAAYGDGTIHSDSRAEGFAVEAIHLEPAYNRYAEKVRI